MPRSRRFHLLLGVDTKKDNHRGRRSIMKPKRTTQEQTPATAAAASDSVPHGGKAAAVSVTTSRQFAGWLAETGASLAVTTYQSGKVILVGSNATTGRISIFERT